MEPARVELLSRAARAARELCELLWEELHQELRHPTERRVRELSERIAEVSSTVAMLTVASGEQAGAVERRTPPEPAAAAAAEQLPGGRPAERPAERSGQRPSERPVYLEPVFTDPSPLRPASSQPAASPPPPPPIPHPAAAPPPSPIPHPAAAASSPPPPAPIPHPAAERGETGRMRLVDEHEQPPAVHREEGASAWVNTVGRLLERHSVDGLPFAVLLVEVVDVAHIERTESPVQVNNLIAQVESALERALRAEDTLTRESFGRYWLVAPETNGTGARMLAERLARLVRTSASHRGAPLEVAVGIAVCPDDGAEAPTLAARADLGVYSARTNRQPVARTDPPA